MTTVKKATKTPARKAAPAARPAKAALKKTVSVKATKKPVAKKTKAVVVTKPVKPVGPGKATTSSKTHKKPVKPGKPPVIKWGPQKFVVNHLKDAVFKTGLRDYAQYRDLGMTEATGGAAQAHVIRLLGKCDPKVVSIPHYHGVQFQMLYFLKGWMIGEYEGQGRVKMTAGSCWLQPPGIRHTVIDYSPDCEMVEIILPANFETVEFE
jgi:mannose-6-phosphate isomerase-like protein (cupin superfamily)